MTGRSVTHSLCALWLFLSTATQAADYVGTQQCATCHEQQTKAWQGSHHDLAMRHANPGAVLGDFSDATLSFNGKENRFFKREQQYWVHIEGADGKFNDYQIKYTFGIHPLQQYMVEFDDGRVQLIPFAWDARAKSAGGQRWFHLYPQFTDHREEFFWTNTGQNWNYMCADCHSTNVKKNFDAKTNTYNTTFDEINVGCEACHGPASEHITWSQTQDKNTPLKGFDRTVVKSVSEWIKQDNVSTLQPKSINESQQTLVCAQCHSRHVQISGEDHVSNKELGQRYILSLINAALYYPDGQIYDENYVYGSFLQSKMSAKGVVCSNCHDPHSAKLIMPQEVVCLQCHESQTYNDTAHHKHPKDSAGSQCVNCHMAETTYMQIDPRRDHGWHIPRPDFAVNLGVKDTCLDCHDDKNSQWSLEQVNNWYPNSVITSERHFAPVFAAADVGMPQAADALSHVSQNKQNANIIRASALERMAAFNNTNTMIAIARGVKDPDSNIRFGAIRGAAGLELNKLWRIIAPLLDDKVLAVRAEAAYSLVRFWSQLSNEQRQQMTPALDDYIKLQEYNRDRGFAYSNLGTVYSYQGDMEKSEQMFLAGIKQEPVFAGSYINLAEVYRRQNPNGAHQKSIEVLEQGLAAVPRNAEIPYNLGLANIRAQQKTKANQYFQMAVEREPNNGQYLYVYGLSLEQTDIKSAQNMLRQAFLNSRNPEHLYALCDMQIRSKAFAARQCIEELAQYAPQQVIEQLQQRVNSQ
ncbi:deca-heme c-type cytochrome [Thalassotalea sp. Y01]|nr:deca-heme c-type cytochrome [Thalassotalea sp. Y01]